MPRGLSLHIGLNRINPEHYDGWDGALTACEFDARDMQGIAESRGFEPTSLITEAATADAITGAIEDAAGRLEPGDAFLVTYSGHGGQVPDTNDEIDGSDETWVAFDRQLVDDELYVLWARFAEGVRIVVLSDSCHSGTVSRGIDDEVPDPLRTRTSAAQQSPGYRALPKDVMVGTYRANQQFYDGLQKQLPTTRAVDPAATVLLISGCQDDQLSLDGFSNGLFTQNLLKVWTDGAWQGSYAAFHEAIRAGMPATQQPNFLRVGAQNDSFERQQPFSVG